MKRLKGPQLKMPELKAPAFAVDLFHDLRDRRLLPLIGVVLAAIVAVPLLLGGGSEESGAPPTAAGAAGAGGQPGVEAARLTVVQSNPGLRDYRKRLAGRGATDPFKQRYSGSALKGAKLNSQAESSSSSTTTSTSTTTTVEASGSESPASGAPSDGGSSPSGGGKGRTGTGAAAFEIDVRVFHNGKQQVRRGLPEMTRLPSKEKPAVVFIGVTGNARKALLLVSSNVESVLGDAKCLLGSKTCDLLAVEPGFPETFVFADGRSYRIKIQKITPVVSRKR
ncbi:MAG: hypothetical protein FVQ78_00575 [Solirubrobacterales bacterium]|nr:hypothetical protein [Solirubrobacterales bacterium]